uniref:Putative secreted peptide n=1 Tax=Anopheles braziliensis TaxID=58242 RepID=A0A2M3ZMB9_9DIPT
MVFVSCVHLFRFFLLLLHVFVFHSFPHNIFCYTLHTMRFVVHSRPFPLVEFDLPTQQQQPCFHHFFFVCFCFIICSKPFVYLFNYLFPFSSAKSYPQQSSPPSFHTATHLPLGGASFFVLW